MVFFYDSLCAFGAQAVRVQSAFQVFWKILKSFSSDNFIILTDMEHIGQTLTIQKYLNIPRRTSKYPEVPQSTQKYLEVSIQKYLKSLVWSGLDQY